MIGSFASKILAASLMAVIPADGLDLPLLGHQEPWRVVFIAVGLPGIVLALLTWTFPEPKRRQRLGGPVKTTFREAAGFMSNRLRFYGWYFLGASAALAANFAFSVRSPAFLMRAASRPCGMASLRLRIRNHICDPAQPDHMLCRDTNRRIIILDSKLTRIQKYL